MANAFLRRMHSDQEWPWEEKARQELNENASANEQLLSAFKSNINEFTKTHPNFRPQLDDELLMAYLRTCKFDLEMATSCYEKFYQVRQCHPEKIFPIGKGPKDYSKYYDKHVVTFVRQRNPLDGALIIIYSFRNFDAREDLIEDILNAGFAILMELVTDPSIQTHGVRLICDYGGVTYSIVKSAMGKMYYHKATQMAQDSSPIRLRGVHLLGASYWLVKIFNAFFRSFMSKEVQKKLMFHQSNKELHQYVCPSVLPDHFDGTAGERDLSWMKEAIDETHDEIVKKSYYGFSEM